jgi:hypothetical protein
MRSRTRAEKRRLAMWRSVSILTVIILVIGGMALVISTQTSARVDPLTLCPQGVPLRSHTLLAADITDLPTHQHRAAFARWVDHLKDGVARYEMLSIRAIADKGDVAATNVFSRCNPGDGRDTSFLWGDPDEIKAQWESSFKTPLLDALNKQLLGRPPTERSAILEALDLIMWDDSFGAQIPARRLIIISDLLQNMPGHNHYKHIPTADEFLATPLGQSLKAKVWTNLKVDIVYLPNAQIPLRQGTKHLKFWRDLFTKLGVAEVRVLPPFALPTARS